MAVATTGTEWYSYTSSTQTMLTWSRVLHSYAEVPAEFQAAWPVTETAFPYTIFAPADRLSFLQKRNAKLLSLCADRVVVLEAGRDRVNVTGYPFQDILYVEQGKVLLHSWITIRSPAQTSTLTFNTVNLHHFEPVLGKIRQAASARSDKGPAGSARPDLSRFDDLMTRNYKFMNYGRQSVRAGDAILQTLYQADRCLKTFKLFNRTLFRQYATGHLSVLTEQELILIKESKRLKRDPRNLYGGVFMYIPLTQIRNLAFIPDTEKARCLMQITFGDKSRLNAEFAMDNAELAAFQEECRHKFLPS